MGQIGKLFTVTAGGWVNAADLEETEGKYLGNSFAQRFSVRTATGAGVYLYISAPNDAPTGTPTGTGANYIDGTSFSEFGIDLSGVWFYAPVTASVFITINDSPVRG